MDGIGLNKKSTSPTMKKGEYSQDNSSTDTGSSSNSGSGSHNNEKKAFEENLIIGVTDERGSLMERSYLVFKPGQWVNAYSKSISKDIQAKYQGQNVQFLFVFEAKGKEIAQHRFTRKFDLSHNFLSFNILPDPDSTQPKSQRWDWSGNLASALSSFPNGNHEIKVNGYVIADGEKTLIVQGRFGYNNAGGNGNMKQYAKKIEKEKGFDITKQNEEFSKKYGRAADNVEQVPTKVYNNCGREIVITFANKKSSSNNVRMRLWETLNIVVNDGESIYLTWKGKSTFSGPTIGSFEKNKLVKLCR